MIFQWKKLFEPLILERGQSYYWSGRVVELEEAGPVICAKVSGTRVYRVEIRNGGDHVRMQCDCPYAVNGDNCKHMAAVFFALEEHLDEHRLSWKTALEQMPEEKLRELVEKLAQGDESLQDRIVRMVSGPGNTRAQWEVDLEQIILVHTDYRGRIGYSQGYDCMLDIVEYLDESLPSFLNKEKIMDAANLVMTVYDTAMGLDIDDSDGGLSYVSDSCKKALDEILNLANTQEERKIFNLLHDCLEQNDWIYGSDDLEDLILSLNWSSDLQEKNLEWLDENLDSWRMSQRARLMERIGASNAEIISWWEQYRHVDSSYHPLLKLYEQTDLPKAIELVLGNRKQEENIFRITEYTKTLLGLLEKAGEQERYDSELRYLVIDLKCHEIQYVSELKKRVSPAEWPLIFKRLLADAVYPSDRMQLYHFEEMYSALFSELSQNPCLNDFTNYEDSLRKWDSNETLKLYTSILKQEMDHACERKQYRHIIRHLHKLHDYPSGEEAARNLAAFWYIYHKNRPAMKDELHMAGYPQK